MKTLPIFLQTLLALALALLLLLPTGCVEPYAPDVIDAPPSLLVVEGFINADGPTTIRLSRTAALDAKAKPFPETKARLLIEDEAGGATFGLSETASGTYVSAANTLSPGRQYRLRITTAKGKQYASAFVPVKITPPISEVRWKPENNTAHILVGTRDDSGNSRYYRWDYDETWEISSPYQPNIEYYTGSDGQGLIRAITTPYPLTCWATNQSIRIQLTTTTALSQDQVTDFRVQGLPSDAPQLYTRYSILVRQRALTAKEYAYWEQLRKNTEALGTLFDPQPSQPPGNVRSLDADGELALGFIGAHSVTEKRLFVSAKELPREWRRRSGYENCLPPDTVFIVPRGLAVGPVDVPAVLASAFSSQRLLPISSVTEGVGTIGYLAKGRDCIDCRTRGTSVRPSFW